MTNSTPTHSRPGNDKLLKSANIIGCLFLLGVNIFSVVVRHAYHWWNLYTYHFSLPKWAFFIWFPINVLLFGATIYQYSSDGKRIIIDGIGWRFPLLTVLTGVHIILWTFGMFLPAFIFAVFVTLTVSHIYYIIKKHYPAANITQQLAIHWPFSLYHGWTTVILVNTMCQVFSRTIFRKILAYIGLFALPAMGAFYVFSDYSKDGDLPAAIAIDWALWAVYSMDTHYRLHLDILCATLGLLLVLKAAHGVLSYKSGGAIALDDHTRDEESTAP